MNTEYSRIGESFDITISQLFPGEPLNEATVDSKKRSRDTKSNIKWDNEKKKKLAYRIHLNTCHMKKKPGVKVKHADLKDRWEDCADQIRRDPHFQDVIESINVDGLRKTWKSMRDAIEKIYISENANLSGLSALAPDSWELLTFNMCGEIQRHSDDSEAKSSMERERNAIMVNHETNILPGYAATGDKRQKLPNLASGGQDPDYLSPDVLNTSHDSNGRKSFNSSSTFDNDLESYLSKASKDERERGNLQTQIFQWQQKRAEIEDAAAREREIRDEAKYVKADLRQAERDVEESEFRRRALELDEKRVVNEGKNIEMLNNMTALMAGLANKLK